MAALLDAVFFGRGHSAMKLGRRAREQIVSEGDRAQLESIARSQSLPAALARRAQMVLRMADGESSRLWRDVLG